MVGALDECFDHLDVPWSARPVKGSAAKFVLQVHVGTLTHQQFDNGQTVPIFENKIEIYHTTLQSMVNAKLSKQRFRHLCENGLIKTIQTIHHNLYMSVKLTSLYCGLRLNLVYSNLQ